MNVFARIEAACAALIERTFARTFPSDVQPAQIARKLIATLEAQPPPPAARYAVHVHPRDFDRLEPERAYLEERWTEMIAEMAERMHVHLAVPPSVVIERDPDVVRGAVAIEPRTVAPAVLSLRVRKGVSSQQRYPVCERLLLVGRAVDCDVVLSDMRVSRRHASIAPDAHGLVLEDLGSSNGSFVNGRRVTRTLLCPGDTVVLGDSELVVERGGDGETAASSDVR